MLVVVAEGRTIERLRNVTAIGKCALNITLTVTLERVQ